MNRKWKTLLVFLLGMVFAELAADPTDYLALSRFQQGGLSSGESLFYWYFLTASFYFAIFLLAYFLSKTGFVEPVHVVYLLMGLVLYGAYKTYVVYGGATAPSYAVFTILLTTTIALGIL